MAAKINKKIETFGVNTIGIDYVLGDIHGRFDLVYENLNNVGFNVETDRLFCVGDLIDRGALFKSCGVFFEFTVCAYYQRQS